MQKLEVSDANINRNKNLKICSKQKKSLCEKLWNKKCKHFSHSNNFNAYTGEADAANILILAG